MFRNIHAILVFIVLAGLSTLAYGQDAQIQGQVLDATGAGISKALVRVVDQQTSTERKIETNDTGQYTVNGLVPGVYKIIVEAPGFSAAVSDQITLNPGQNAVMDFTMKVGATSADVVVTAEKRDERLLDVPIPVSVLNPQALTGTSQVLLRDYYATIPNLAVTPNIEGSQVLSIRGITTGVIGTPTVGVTIDDVPFGATGGRGGGSFVPDIDPGDLAQIEVLRGPQGTLYGANSMGGLVKYVTTDPSTEQFSGRIEGGYDSVYNGAEPGFNLRASANIPLTGTFAIRVSGFERQDPGYIDNPGICGGVACAPIRGINDGEAGGGRISALWKPTDRFRAKLSASYQRDKTNGLSEVDQGSGLGDLQQDYIAGLGGVDRTVQAYGANISYWLGDVQLTSLTGYNVYHLHAPFDFTPFLGSDTENGVPGTSFTGFGVTGTGLFNHINYEKITQELRASRVYGKRMDWVAGGFFSHENDANEDIIQGINNATGQWLGLLWDYHFPDIYQEFAGFANLTFHFTERFDVQIGGRESHNSTKEGGSATGPFALPLSGSDPFNAPLETESGSSFTYSFTPSYKLNSNVLLYGRVASGYRPGSPNANAPGIPAQKPDTTINYEVGAKGDLLDHKLTLDTSVFYIDWSDIQLSLINPPHTTYGYNGSGAKSTGVEISAEARPITGMLLSGWFTYDDADLTQDFLPLCGPAITTTCSATYGVAGNRLPNTPQFSTYASAQQDFRLRSRAVGYVGGEVSYLGNRIGPFQATPLRQTFPAFTKVDLRVGIRSNSWNISAFANNVADTRGMLNGGIGYTQPNGYVYIQPRLAGVSIAKTF